MPDLTGAEPSFEVVLESLPASTGADSLPSLISFDNVNAFDAVILRDSIIDYYPYLQITLGETKGDLTETAFFVEGLDFRLKIGTSIGGYIAHEFYLSEMSIQDPNAGSQFISGVATLPFLSKMRKIDKPRSKSYRGLISSVARQIISPANEYALATLNVFNRIVGPNNLQISSTSGTGVWYQLQETDGQFLEKLSKYALSITNPKSPFFTFFNLKNEFYFMSFVDMFNQTPIKIGGQLNRSYKINVGSNAGIDLTSIQTYSVLFTGAPYNMPNYNRLFNSYNGLGIVEPTFALITNYAFKTDISPSVLSVKRLDTAKIRNVTNYGLVEDLEDRSAFNGYVNYQYINTVLSYRIEITTLFNPDAVSGRIVELQINSADTRKVSSLEFSGRWLIINTQHAFGAYQTTPLTTMTLAKPTISLNSKHRFSNDLITATSGGTAPVSRPGGNTIQTSRVS